ncbi:hypothetical protein COW94_03475 [Candidatus Peregrinibacteria bacterium CG22_combo_CG10-13_8_21_14_all_44_10]|nr:MAG: hypothetical protein AUK45_04930 [Candidatus Peregrinibacteria bacterium CG2_30_44_17]PIP66118.1 MAG: hypothetical protein COW94_03475 [Candidatus Peregrinibacteria bacterium CG22_combo_CG10-13_8_21_14_all_44_10]PIS03808.1 MAG: hypothetical protein COT83_04065 [Candidatus Peregrinibacteria bacterium CG10_big_fil_rev_8_21_14_0_10_44_7]PIX80420.1 MAG: hypothetical protein COZ35_00750 [Candidatus Peregrinibacteria bacterium CG_4_10_14_3_um_filter_44_21]PJB88402.1 MAG: hypothetical protein 
MEPNTAEREDTDVQNTELSDQQAEQVVDKTPVNTESLETALAKAKKLEATLDSLDGRDDGSEVYNLIADVFEAIYESGIWKSAEGVWNNLSPGIQKALLGKGLVGFTINNISVGRPVVEAFRGLAQTGMIQAPEGIDPASFTKDTLKMLKVARWLIVIGAFVQPEIAPLEALIPVMEKLVVKYDHLTGVIRVRIEEISDSARGQAQKTLGSEIIREDTPGNVIPLFSGDTDDREEEGRLAA